MDTQYNVTDELAASIMERADWGKVGLEKALITESEKPAEKKVVTESKAEDTKEVVEDKYTCLVCESELDAPLSDDKIMEGVDKILDILESLNEDSDKDEDEDTTLEEDAEEDVQENIDNPEEYLKGKKKGSKHNIMMHKAGK